MSAIPGNRNQFDKFFRTEPQCNRDDTQISSVNSSSFYNLKDFLPSSSKISTENRLKTKSFITPSTTVNKPVSFSSGNIEEKVIQQKMNKLKQENAELQKALQSQTKTSLDQEREIIELRRELQAIKTTQIKRKEKLTMWSYKYHIQYSPKQKHKYSLAIQTDDVFSNKIQSSGSLKAKDFEQIYKRLNTNQSVVQMGTRKIKKQGKPSFNPNQNQSQIIKNSTVKLGMQVEQNRSLFRMPNWEEPKQRQGKQNIMLNSNINFSKNPMTLNLDRIQSEQKPITEQCLELYPVQEEYLDSIVGELLCEIDPSC